MVIRVTRCWDGSPVGPDEEVRVELTDEGGVLRIAVDAPFHGDPPPPGPPGPTARLWEHEVVEVFVAGGAGYTEVELSPWGHHLVLRLGGVREVREQGLPLQYTARAAGGRWTGVALLDRALLPELPHRVNAVAAHGMGPRRFLSAVPLPGARPDFHQPHLFLPREG